MKWYQMLEHLPAVPLLMAASLQTTIVERPPLARLLDELGDVLQAHDGDGDVDVVGHVAG